MKYQLLSDVANITMGQSPPSETYNEIGNGIEFLQGKAEFGKLYPKAKYFCSNPKKKSKKDDILMSVRAPVGDMNISDKPYCIGRGLAAIHANLEITDNKYLYYYLLSIQKLIEDKGTGSTFKAVNKKTLEELPVFLPPLETQQKIVAVLDQAQALIDLKKQQLALLQDLTQSIFYDMFGDPVTNPKGWEVLPFEKFSESRLGKMLDEKSNKGNSLCPYLGNSNVRWFEFDLENLKEMDFSSDEKEKFLLKQGDLLICEGGEVGRCAIWQNELTECFFQKAIHRVRVNNEIAVPEYIQFVMWCY